MECIWHGHEWALEYEVHTRWLWDRYKVDVKWIAIQREADLRWI